MTGATGGANKEVDEKIILLSEKISALVQEAETSGCAGNVEQVGKTNKNRETKQNGKIDNLTFKKDCLGPENRPHCLFF